MSHTKELCYFWRDDWQEQRRGYEEHFDTDAPVRGESTPAYAAYPVRAHVPERMYELIPDAKLIYLVRDPIARTLSHWVQRRADGDRTSFERYMAQCDREDNPIVCPSRYWLQISRSLRRYDASQLLVVDQHDLKARRRETMREIFAFVGVDASFESPEFAEERNAHAEKTAPRSITARVLNPVLWPVSRTVPRHVRDRVRTPANRLLFAPPPAVPNLTPEARERLQALLTPEVESLRQFTGKRFESWSV